ncbi:MAG: YitT family protein [Clostridia bacterium]|nr:YitT family protein [Clostridia bacterium]
MKQKIKEYALILLGAFLLAFAVQVFLVPAKISTGGASGIGTVLFYTLGIPLFVTVPALNAVIFIFGFRSLPRRALIKSLFGVAALSVFLSLTQRLPVYRGNLILGAVFGGAIAGVGVGLTLLQTASTGGTDLVALVLHGKKPHLTPGSLILWMDSAIILSSGFFLGDLTVILSSLISLYISNLTVDWVLTRGDLAKSVWVISSAASSIAGDIHRRLGRGVTGITVRRYYSNTAGEMLFCVLKNRQVPLLLELIHRRDPAAFTFISDVRKVRGEGF